MTRVLVYCMVLFFCLSSCASNPSPPAVLDVSLDKGYVLAGTTNKVSATYRISATKVSGNYVSESFSSIVNIPIGASYVEGSSLILFQSGRVPDLHGLCPDGRSYLIYNFKGGEFIDTNESDPFIGVIVFDLLLQADANKQEVVVAASETSGIDPCGPLDGESARIGISGL